MNLIDAYIEKIKKVKVENFGYGLKYIIICDVIAEGVISEHTEIVDIEEDWTKKVYVGKKITI